MKLGMKKRRADNDIHRRFKFPKVSAARNFSGGSGPLESQLRRSKFEDGNAVSVAMSSQSVSDRVKEMGTLPISCSRSSSTNASTSTVQGTCNPPNPKRLKPLPLRRDFPAGCGNFVSAAKLNDFTGNLKVMGDCRQSSALASLVEDDARRVASSSLDRNKFKDVVVGRKRGVLYVDNEAVGRRESVVKALNMFHDILTDLLQERKGKSKTQGGGIYVDAALLLRQQDGWVNVSKRVGPVPGVEVGDKFKYRAELTVIGLHHKFDKGIDCMVKDGNILATSIVDSDRYENYMKSPDVLVFSGEGGNPLVGNKEPTDQKLAGGNLALKNSKDSTTPVRTIRKFKISEEFRVVGTSGKEICNSMFVYDGLYIVVDYWQERGKYGKLVFKFLLRRIAGQPVLEFGKFVNKSGQPVLEFGKFVNKSRDQRKKNDILVNDISQGKEKFAVCLKNAIDGDQLPSFDYIINMVYPCSFVHSIPAGCDCTDGCTNSKKCACAIKNGNAIPYNSLGRIVTDNLLVYECGPSCRCSSACINRVGQNGIQFQLEVFKNKLMQWGVRSRSYIPKGSFVCEYIGEVVHGKKRNGDLNRFVCDLGNNFFIDGVKFGNVARFINHSCSPNLVARDVLYDHDDERIPHVMLFATKDIPPSRELTFDYNFRVCDI
ncbi:hypothetical protein FNV43_RR24309 [Rhamnella rubrinervis]|uniref:Uncharacterized protein n=1 Tax=Rhamnella rubrinervis TaxID=2594499 RepID=A0A8K0DXU9_9ROSA|nr:hypothetical protein FNV43_RR24309 [Rhamnella rubrinervis]